MTLRSSPNLTDVRLPIPPQDVEWFAQVWGALMPDGFDIDAYLKQICDAADRVIHKDFKPFDFLGDVRREVAVAAATEAMVWR